MAIWGNFRDIVCRTILYNVGSQFEPGQLIRTHYGLKDDMFEANGKFDLREKLGRVLNKDMSKLTRDEVLETISALKSSNEFSSFQKEAADLDIILSTSAAEYKPKSEIRSENFHYGIGNIEDYTHFTSPIRRCADQLVHWTLKGKNANRIDPELSKIPNDVFYTNKQLQREWNKLMGIMRIHLDYPDGIPVKLVVFKDHYTENGQIGIEFLISGYECHENHRNYLLRVRNDEDDTVDFIYKYMKDVNWDGVHGFHQVLVGTKMAAGSFCMKNCDKKGENNEKTVEIGEFFDGKMVYDEAELMTTYIEFKNSGARRRNLSLKSFSMKTILKISKKHQSEAKQIFERAVQRYFEAYEVVYEQLRTT